MSAWLSLVGIPKNHASVAHTTIANSAALSATIASCEFVPKSTILVIVIATFELTMLITKTPRKLNTAARSIAALADRHLVTTQVAIALGASVQPLTSITPIVNKTATMSRGLSAI